jgi:S-adenosylmethionine:tRNA ribosyltransferase-isomerase
MMSEDLLTSSYDYDLPQNLIATKPIYPKDSAKLLVYNRATDCITHTTFSHLLEFLPPKCDVFINDTKVIKARIYGTKASGGKAELLLNKPLSSSKYLVLIRGKVKQDTTLYFDKDLTAKVIKLNEDGSRVVEFYHQSKPIEFEKLVLLLEEIGHIPLPPYMQRDDNSQDSIDYQTLFASKAGAVAAPTASLHFTHELLEELKAKYQTYTLTLHVGVGTFKPVEAPHILNHPMHSEYFEIPKSVAKILDSNQDILAIGTTVTRTIEYYARTHKLNGECNLFLHPNNPPKRVNHLLTNFHLPKSTLIMLVSSFVGREKTLALYEEAIQHRYRFYSYGDAMLII